MDFACGHIGLMTEVKNVAIIKQRLAPAIRNLKKSALLSH